MILPITYTPEYFLKDAETHEDITKKYREIVKPIYDKGSVALRNKRIEKDPQLVLASHAKNLAHAFLSQKLEIPNCSFGKEEAPVIKEMEIVPLAKTGEWAFGAASYIGERLSMEDRMLLPVEVSLGAIKGVLFGVFDGHAGPFAAESLKNNLEESLADEVADLSISISDETTLITAALIQTFIREGRLFRNCGTTVTAGLIIGKKIYIANLGDSRTIYIDPLNGPKALSDDAKPFKPRFARRVKKRGGEIINGRINGELNVMGSLGDGHIMNRNGDNSVPQRSQITTYELNQSGHLILATDGLFNVASTDDIDRVVQSFFEKHMPLSQIASRLVTHAYSAGSKDNISVLVIKPA
jgi:protein phosphatase 1L